MKHTLHVIALPHTRTDPEYGSCAYTTKVYRFCKMMHAAGHKVFHYGNEGSPVKTHCTEDVQIYSFADQEHHFGHFEWYQQKAWFRVPWDLEQPYWVNFNAKAIEELRSRIQPHDFICLIGGRAQMVIAEAFLNNISVEYGIGYEGVFTRFRCFESYAWMHHVYGLYGEKDGNFYDAVVPNYFDIEDFTYEPDPYGWYNPHSQKQEPYALFMSRMVNRKGYDIACEATKHAGIKLIIAGSPDEPIPPGMDHVEHVGYANRKRRNQLMGNAVCLLAPTKYIEPFGGVIIEANLCGTPVITTDWGGFAENVIHGITGYRCRQLEHFVWALKNVQLLDRRQCHFWAKDNFSTEHITEVYEEYFDGIARLRGPGWYSENNERIDLSWLDRAMP